MKIFKIVLLIIGIIIAIPLTIALFTQKNYAIEREILIDKPKSEVFSYIKYIKNQSNYSKWVMIDPNVKMEYVGEDGRVGFTSKWDSENENVGKGEQTIKGISEGEKLDLAIHFIKPFEGLASAYISTDSITSTQTKVKWGFSSTMVYPTNIFLLIMDMDKMVGDDLQVGLQNLKAVLEK